MAKYLVIVESPAKVKTIKKFLGVNYEVMASNGHVRDLPKSRLGIDVENDYEPKYITIRGKGDILAALRKEVKKAEKIYLATDPDREGEAISWHLYEALKLGIEAFNCESLQEIFVINEMAHHLGTKANVSVRINPDIDAHTHKYVTTGLYENKFGISQHEFDKLIEILKKSEHINFIGLHFHIGSQITRVNEVYALECKRVNDIVRYFEEEGLKVDNINLGGGLGVDYDDPDGNPIADFKTWFETIRANIIAHDGQKIHIEPGRSMVAHCASLISRVLFVKSGETKNFLILDAGMNDLIRPALYGAYHKIENLSAAQRTFFPTHQAYDIVGPVCESSDVWGAGRLLPLSVRGDLMAIRSAGAYGQVMASRYNMKDLAPSVFSDALDEAPEAVDYFA